MSEMLSPAEELFVECWKQLDRVSAAFLNSYMGSQYPSEFEADMAGMQLLNVTYQHVNAMSAVAELKYVGSHFTSAQALCRAALESGFTALWLLEEDDWRLREARWLRWVRREEKHQLGLSRSVQQIAPELAARLTTEAGAYKERRTKITDLLKVQLAEDGLEADTESSPSFEQILKEVGLADRLYVRYRLLSHALHGGPTSASSSLTQVGTGFTFYKAHSPWEWSDLFELAAYSLRAPLDAFLKRLSLEADRSDLTEVEFNKLLLLTDELKGAYKLTGK